MILQCLLSLWHPQQQCCTHSISSFPKPEGIGIDRSRDGLKEIQAELFKVDLQSKKDRIPGPAPPSTNRGCKCLEPRNAFWRGSGRVFRGKVGRTAMFLSTPEGSICSLAPSGLLLHSIMSP